MTPKQLLYIACFAAAIMALVLLALAYAMKYDGTYLKVYAYVLGTLGGIGLIVLRP